MAALYDGSNPPLEALGVSAKFYATGRVADGRYHVALQPPCDCGGLAPARVLGAARG